MSIIFPKNPYVGILFSVGETIWTWDGTVWNIYDPIVRAQADFANVSVDTFKEKSVESKLATVVYNVTITGPQNPDTGNKYNLNGIYRPIPNFVVGYTYVFVQDDQTNVYFPNANGTTLNPHPLNFSSNNLSGILGGGTSYLTNVRYFLNGLSVTQAVYISASFNTAQSRQVWITITNSTPSTLYYWCWNHTAMGNAISVADPGSGSDLNFLSAGAGIDIADDSTVKIISNTGVLDIIAGSGISKSTNQGVVTINADTGNLTFIGNTIDTADSTPITITPVVNFDSNVVVGNVLVFSDGTTQSTAQLVGPSGAQGPAGASGSGSGDVLSSGGGYVDNAIIRYDGITGTIIQNSTATINDAGLLTATNFSGGGASITALNATQLTSGTIPDARFPATLPAVSGVNLTALPATLPAASGTNLTALNATQLTSGTVPVLRLGDSGTRDATTYLRGDNTWATVSGGSASDSFATIAVAGQNSVVADSATDTLTLVAGSNITLTTNDGTDTITIAATGAAGNSFETISVAGQSNVVADSATDTLTLVAGTGISITTNSGTDTVTITSTVSAGATAFTGLTDAAGLTVDQFYLPGITRLNVTANSSIAYRFDQYGTADNPTIYAISGTTIAFNLTGSNGHPFLIRFAGANYNTGLVHVTTAGVVTTGSSAQGKQNGTLYWKLPAGISGTYGYLCGNHGGMAGDITVKDISVI